MDKRELVEVLKVKRDCMMVDLKGIDAGIEILEKGEDKDIVNALSSVSNCAEEVESGAKVLGRYATKSKREYIDSIDGFKVQELEFVYVPEGKGLGRIEVGGDRLINIDCWNKEDKEKEFKGGYVCFRNAFGRDGAVDMRARIKVSSKEMIESSIEKILFKNDRVEVFFKDEETGNVFMKWFLAPRWLMVKRGDAG